jgi:hypothetical protein
MRTLLAALAVFLGSALLVACGGAESEEEDPGTEGTDEVALAVSETGTPEAAEAAPMTCSFPMDARSFRITATVETSGVDFEALFIGLAEGLSESSDSEGSIESSDSDLLESFDGSSAKMTIEYAFVVPDRYSIVMTIGGQEVVSYIRIGSRGWIKEAGSTDWTEEAGSTDWAEESASQTDFPSWLQDICAIVEQLPISAELQGKETLNGIETLHYRISDDSSTQQPPVEDLPSEVTSDVWLAEDGNWLVKMVFQASYDDSFSPYSQHIDWEVSDLNDPSIVIEPPNIR